MFLGYRQNLKHLGSPMSHPAGQAGGQLEEAGFFWGKGGGVQADVHSETV